jgi:nitroreductase
MLAQKGTDMKINPIILFVGVAIGAAAGLMYPQKSGGDILTTIDARASTREFSSEPIDDKTMNEIMWAAFGKNSRGTRTIPTGRNQQNLKVFAIRADGAFSYDGEKLIKISDDDLRPMFAVQPYVMDAPLTLVFTGSDKEFSPMHAGSAYQNVGLYCAERGIGNVVRAYFDKQAVAKALNLPAGESALISQTIGWKK